MRLQDETPYDHFLLAMNNLYYPIDPDKFYLNSPFVESNFNILVTGKTYLVINADRDNNLTLKLANLIDVCSDGMMMNIFLHDIVNGQRIHLEFDIYQRENQCSFKLVEADYFQKKIMFLTYF